MRQIRITTQSFTRKSDDDCYLDPSDPIHELNAVSALGGLGSNDALARYNQMSMPKIVGSDKGKVQREQNIKPGTEEWFKLWFGRNNENT